MSDLNISEQGKIDIERRTLRITRDFKASPERVFDAFAMTEQYAMWCPEGMKTVDARLDVRIGGHWTTTMENAEGQHYTATGVYTVIERPDRLAFTWGWVIDGQRDHETVVDLYFERIEGGTRLHLVQRVFETEEDRNDHNKGWDSCFNMLEKALPK